jgi:hypothetical protein
LSLASVMFTGKMRPGLERLVREKRVSLIQTFVNCSCKKLETLGPGGCIIKLITALIYGFRNKLECLPLNTRLG